MKQRYVIVPIDSICEMLKDYCGPEDLPPDTTVTRLLINKQESGKIALELESSAWVSGLAPLTIRFDLKRVHSVGGVGGQ